MEIWFDEAEALVGREVDAWIIDGGKCHPFNLEAAAEDVTRVAVDLELLSGSFTISGTMELEERNHQLEGYVRGRRGKSRVTELLSIPAVEPKPYRHKCQPWQRRKKGRS